MKSVELLRIGLLWLPLSAIAAPPLQHTEPAQTGPAPDLEVAAMLELQRSGRYASPHRQTLPGAAQTRVWERYLKSFEEPIPDHYIDKTFQVK